MAHVTDKAYSDCALLDDLAPKSRAVLGGTEKKQWIFGSNQTIPITALSLALTFSSLTGGLITTVDHSIILATKQGSAPLNRTRIDNKSSSGFTLIGDGNATFSIIAMVTAPSVSKYRSTPKWSKDYCAGCKEQDQWANIGSIYRDISLLNYRVTLGAGGTLAFAFKDYALEESATGLRNKMRVQSMEDTDYQIILFPSSTAAAAYPYPSSITEEGFTITGDANEIISVLILGQIGSVGGI